MTDLQWNAFCAFKDDFKKKIREWNDSALELKELQKKAAEFYETPDYPFETPVVYNRDLDSLAKEDRINLIVIGDNPGKDEQLAKNNRYLVGQAGKIADGFFRRNSELCTDFRKNVIILNKTPVHSAKTAHLKKIMKDGGIKIQKLIEESELWMARRTAELHCDLVAGALEGKTLACKEKSFGAGAGGLEGNAQHSAVTSASFDIPELWLVGYSELKEKGLFLPYRNCLKATYLEKNPSVWEKVFVFQHFSMNRFTVDLKEFSKNAGVNAGARAEENSAESSKKSALGAIEGKGTEDLKAAEDLKNSSPLLERLHALGNLHKKEIFG